MSDGIIQNVIKKYMIEYTYNNDVMKGMLITLQQELIQKIRQHHFDDDAYFNDTIKQILIGDNHD